jgi:hypothetical protein
MDHSERGSSGAESTASHLQQMLDDQTYGDPPSPETEFGISPDDAPLLSMKSLRAMSPLRSSSSASATASLPSSSKQPPPPLLPQPENSRPASSSSPPPVERLQQSHALDNPSNSPQQSLEDSSSSPLLDSPTPLASRSAFPNGILFAPSSPNPPIRAESTRAGAATAAAEGGAGATQDTAANTFFPAAHASQATAASQLVQQDNHSNSKNLDDRDIPEVDNIIHQRHNLHDHVLPLPVQTQTRADLATNANTAPATTTTTTTTTAIPSVTGQSGSASQTPASTIHVPSLNIDSGSNSVTPSRRTATPVTAATAGVSALHIVTDRSLTPLEKLQNASTYSSSNERSPPTKPRQQQTSNLSNGSSAYHVNVQGSPRMQPIHQHSFSAGRTSSDQLSETSSTTPRDKISRTTASSPMTSPSLWSLNNAPGHSEVSSAAGKGTVERSSYIPGFSHWNRKPTIE